MKRLAVAVVGCGHLGTIHARLLAARSDVELVAVVDPSQSHSSQHSGFSSIQTATIAISSSWASAHSATSGGNSSLT